MERIRLFCFGYAGGSSMFYKSWKNQLLDNIEIYPVELPGHGTRMSEDPCQSINDMVDDIFLKIKPYLYKPFALFGHSMGTIIITELLFKLQRQGYREPIHVFFSGRFPPHINEGKFISELPDKEFRQEIYQLGGTPKDLVENEELFNIFMPILRADYKSIEDYRYLHKDAKWNINISVLYGKFDKEVEKYQYNEWENYTTGTCCYYEFLGNHFFIHSHFIKIIKKINMIILHQYGINDFRGNMRYS
ncbi:thioesterase [Clostridium estertheticum]|uniref:Thioesterase n=1 Tax=Clostridium estertheticum TaxID=238834 RepID=A0A5N7IUT6_9CLOT|nr:alpha/beta fold hydrolase [Clostridium estertheticum]MPQ34075.1 thioesterase [Clostridium estertheticum]MPQ64876.1 thioesterase [Clostridium estertheticum]